MLTLAAWLRSENISNARFARTLADRLGRKVSDQNVSRWTRDPADPEYGIPEPKFIVAIYFLTRRQVRVESWYQHLVKEAARRPKKAA